MEMKYCKRCEAEWDAMCKGARELHLTTYHVFKEQTGAYRVIAEYDTGECPDLFYGQILTLEKVAARIIEDARARVDEFFPKDKDMLEEDIKEFKAGFDTIVPRLWAEEEWEDRLTAWEDYISNDEESRDLSVV